MSKQRFLAYVTDVHGELEKLEQAVSLFSNKYPADYFVLGGDIASGYVRYYKSILQSRDEPIEPFEEYKERIFKEALKVLGTFLGKTFAIVGNDDFPEYIELLDKDENVENLNCKIYNIDDHILVGFHYVPPTPFGTRFELEEKELEKNLIELLESVPNHNNAIWIFHSPPYNSGLDNTIDLDRKMIKVGSKVIRKAIEKYQPKLFLCGHIHESRGMKWIGNSLCINPGAVYLIEHPKAVYVNLDNVEKTRLVSL